jgi:hypothetical protein
MKNILNLKINKLAADAVERVSILLGAFNSFSSRFFSYLNPAFLDFLGRSVKMPQGSS